MARPDNTGECDLCGHQAANSAMARHVLECAPAHEPKGKRGPITLLRVEGAEDPRYWLYVEASAEATLEKVDSLLRHLWLECCGHMSVFRVGKTEPDKGSKVGKVLRSERLRFSYEYDFGSTTALEGQVVGTRNGSPPRTGARLLARNNPIAWSCEKCPTPATVVCPFCIYEGGAFFCEAHAGKHKHAKEEVYLPVVNSPRMGVCGYTG